MKRLLLLTVLLACAGHASAIAVFVVDRNDDTNVGACTDAANDCTLRGAINTANATAQPAVINFAIASGVQTINVGAGGLPDITVQVTIDGTTQPGFNGTPLIELNGAGAGANISGLHISAASTAVRALAINRFTGSGIFINFSAGGTTIQGCFLGTDIAGTADLGNAVSGVLIDEAANCTIGGATVGAGNLISGNDSNGVLIGASNNTVVQGNYIGTDVTGTADLGNAATGVAIQGALSCTIGGTTAAARNLISGNRDGVAIAGVGTSDNLVQGNFIGTDVTGTARLSNANIGVIIGTDATNNTLGGTAAGARNLISGNIGSGVVITGSNGNLVQGNFIGTDITGIANLGNGNTGVGIVASNNTIGGEVAGAGNTIAYNNATGVSVGAGTGNQIFGNSIYHNGELGIDLDPDGVTPNDAGDGDAGVNNQQNFPVIQSAVSSNGTTTIQGTLDSVPNGVFFIDFYSSSEADPSGFGEGQNYLGTVRAGDERGVRFSFTVNSDLAGQLITATATNVSTGDTSEFSAALLAGGATPTPGAQPLNISTRLRVQTGDNVLIGGFIIRGSAPKKIIVRALGPSLADSGIVDVLADPVIELHGSDGELIAQNDNWRETQETQIQESGLAPENDSEAAIIATLPPNGYTVIVRGKNESTGLALVEAYDLQPAVDSEFANISTRGLVEAGDNVMIGGFILGGEGVATQVALRGLGQSLANTGLSNVVANPTLDLRDANGARIVFNDDWMDNPAQAVQLTANGLALQDPHEAGIFTTLAPGPYTVILAGENGGVGVGLVEVYKVDR